MMKWRLDGVWQCGGFWRITAATEAPLETSRSSRLREVTRCSLSRGHVLAPLRTGPLSCQFRFFTCGLVGY